ncbi:hypothetical protein CDL15_Pgr012642 [Punica granatum]|uniref:Myb-like domain-containing protein n=1 Tax=Punica granatum TaxID=22663 RepID=A0A218WRA0_PUNGR|nr:hypothetical protein CDL15_Pgr012642 [Punica granatum]PKI58362.1 hypothetical protein CRG98_021237 [Punica granatum]
MDGDACLGSRHTRSLVAPDWSVTDSLILVNEMSTIDGDYLNALSSYQKWNVIAHNCTKLDVVRTLNQCRRKWESLLDDYGRIVEYKAQLSHDPY